MGLGSWMRRKMEADDGYDPRPDEIVTAGHVNVVLSPIVVGELEVAGIRAHAVEERHPYGGMIRMRINCFAPDQDAAAAIIERIVAETSEPTRSDS